MRYFYLLLFLILSSSVFCQNYTRDAGVRFGEGFFVSYRQFYSDNTAIEGMIGNTRFGLKAILMKEYLQPLQGIRSENLMFIFGYGIHAGVAYTNHYTFMFRTYYHEWKFTPQIGLDGLAGLEYTLPEYPVLIRVAVQPYFEYSLNRYFQLKAFNFVVSFNYRF